MRRLTAAIAGWSDRRLVLVLGAIFFVTLAWPVFVLPIPPYQDLPGHLATATILAHPDRYPEYVSNGLLKSNAALVAWTYFAGKAIGLAPAARVFIAGTLAATAFVLPWFILQFTDRRRLLVAAPFAWPMVHNWFVAMGMVNFALGVAATLALLVLLDRQRRQPSAGALRLWLRGAAIVLVGLVAWYASSVPPCIAILLVAIEIAIQPTWRARVDLARRVLPPLVPIALLVAAVVVRHALATSGGAGAGRFGEVEDVAYQAPGWLAYDLWARWFYTFTELEAVTLVPAIVLGAIALVRLRRGTPFFSPAALAGMAVLYVFLPWMLPGFGYVNVRLVPFFWMAALVRVPDRLPRFAWGAVAAAGAINAAGIGADMFRLARDQAEYAAGVSVVPEGSRLLALTFTTRVTSKNTWSLAHASGLYVLERLTSAQDVWADSPTMPIAFRDPPTFFEDQLQILRFVASAASPDGFCEGLRARGLVFGDCRAAWRSEWDGMWRAAAARFDHALLFAAPDEVLAIVPLPWRVAFHRGRLVVLERAGVTAGSGASGTSAASGTDGATAATLSTTVGPE